MQFLNKILKLRLLIGWTFLYFCTWYLKVGIIRPYLQDKRLQTNFSKVKGDLRDFDWNIPLRNLDFPASDNSLNLYYSQRIV